MKSIVESFVIVATLAASAQAQEDLGAKVVEILKAKCAWCHSAEGKKAARDSWADVTDLKDLRQRFIVKPESRTLKAILTDKDDGMPPEKAKTGPLAKEQLETILKWIDAGAPDPKSPVPVEVKADPKEPLLKPAEMSSTVRTIRWLGKFHIAIIHFPVALMMVAALAELLGGRRENATCIATVAFCVPVAVLSAVAAATTGWIYAWFDAVGPRDVLNLHPLNIHRWLGTFTTVWAIFSWGMLRRTSRDPAKGRGELLWILVVGAVLVGLAGHYGGALVHGPNHYAW